MKARDRAAVGALRSALAAVGNAEAVETQHAPTASGGTIAGSVAGLGAGDAARRELSDADVAAIVATEVDDRLHAANEYERLDRGEDAARLRAEAAVLSAFVSVDDPPAETADAAATAAGEGVPEQ